MFPYPHCYTPTEEAKRAAYELLARVRTYMKMHPDSELHRRGKMFGVLIVQSAECKVQSEVLYAFSGMLDGRYEHEGFVAPVYAILPEDVVGENKADSQRKQHDLFMRYRLLNARGEVKTVLDCWADEPTFGGYPPAGTGECCAPKLLQAAYQQGLIPQSMAEIWIGASPADEVRIEGQFYPACISKCRPILRHMLSGLMVAENPLVLLGKKVAQQVKVLYEDECLIVVDKPSGLLSVPGKEGQYSLMEHVGGLSVHRLDMDTSGVMVMAKNVDVQRELQRQFFAHEVEKTYLAEVAASNTGNPCETSDTSLSSGTISLPLAANPIDRPRQVVDYEHGKRAVTHYQLLDGCPSGGNPGKGLLYLLTPETGRTHQLRVHCAVGLKKPILGDRLYGNGVGALHLHAHSLTFTHPRTGERMTFRTDPSWLHR